jgi:hypothetical protein
MGMSKSTQQPTELNSIEVTDLESAAEALDYLNEDYNNGTIAWAEADTVLVVVSRSKRFQHHGFFRDNPNIEIQHPAALQNDDTGRLHLKLELTEAADD